MKIEKFTKLRNGIYKLKLEDGRDIKVHEEVILKNNILLSREITEEDILNIDKLNNNYSCYDMALKYISTRYRSIYEVRVYLKNKNVDDKIIDITIEKLKMQKYLDDRVYAKAFVNDRINFSNYGPYKIKRELESVRVDNNIIDEVLSLYNDKLQAEKLNKLVPKYVNTVRSKSASMIKEKTKNYFINLGYDMTIVRDILDNIQIDDSKARDKEYEKLYNKYSKKYEGSELDYKIKQALYQKGYR